MRQGGLHTWFALPHIPQNLNMACDLLLGSLYGVLVEIVDEKLIPPSAPAAGLGVGCVGRVPVLLEALDENGLDGFWPDLGATSILEELAMLALGGDAGDGGVVLGLHGRRRHFRDESTGRSYIR